MRSRLSRLSLVAAFASTLVAVSNAAAQVSRPAGVNRSVAQVAPVALAWQSREGKSSKLPIVVGALAGAGVGVIALFAQSDCRRVESMCGLAIPLYVGGGALLGGAIGYIWSRR
jgi:hypothetical protein